MGYLVSQDTGELFGLGVAVAVSAVIGGISLWSARSIGRDLEVVARDKFPSAEALAELQQGTTTVSYANSSLFNRLLTDEQVRRGLFDSIDEALKQVLRKYDAIMGIMLPTLRAERAATYSPVLPVSPSSGVVTLENTMGRARANTAR